MWWPAVFWILLLPLLIVLGITYASTKKLYRLCQLLALFTYIVMIAYVIDSFMLGKNWILFLLFLSTLLIIGAGVYVSRKKSRKKKKICVWPLWIILGVMFVLLVIGMFGSLYLERTVEILPLPETTSDEGVAVLSLTYTNNYFLPVGFPRTDAQLCSDGEEYYGPWLENAYQDSYELMPGETNTVNYRLRGGPNVYPREKIDLDIEETQEYPQGMYIVLGERDVSCARYNERFDLN